MSHPVFGEFLILFLLLVSGARIFFLKYGKLDTLTILAPLSLLLSILQIASWGADTFSTAVFALSFFAFAINFRSLLRFTAGLYVDRYSVSFKTGAFFLLVLATAVLAALLYFKPLNINAKRSDVIKQKIAVSGSFTSGFEGQNHFSLPSGEIYIYSPAVHSENGIAIQNAEQASADANDDGKNGNAETAANDTRTIIFVSDKRADSFHYEPLFYALAERGFKIYTGNFYLPDLKWYKGAANSKPLRRFTMVLDSILHTERFKAQQDFFSFNSAKEFEVLLNFAKENEAERFSPVFIVGDWMAERAIPDFCRLHSGDVRGGVSLSAFPEYETPGFGCIRITNPLLAFYFRLERAKDYSQAEQTAFALIRHMDETEKDE
ncbi:MAG: hypothetical protein ACTTKL_01930 [Treponema sp.]